MPMPLLKRFLPSGAIFCSPTSRRGTGVALRRLLRFGDVVADHRHEHRAVTLVT
jgi:hypothetical protein